MSESCRRRQHAGYRPACPDCAPDGFARDYAMLVTAVAASLTAWKRQHDPRQQLDPRRDPRCPKHRGQRARAE